MNPEELRAKAEAATPGPWQVYEQHLDLEAPKQQALDEFSKLIDGQEGGFVPVLPMLTDGAMCPAVTGCGPKSLANAEFIAAANPATVLSLLTELAAARAELAALDPGSHHVEGPEDSDEVCNVCEHSLSYDPHTLRDCIRNLEAVSGSIIHSLSEENGGLAATREAGAGHWVAWNAGHKQGELEGYARGRGNACIYNANPYPAPPQAPQSVGEGSE